MEDEQTWSDQLSFLHINQTCIIKYRFLWVFSFISDISLLNLPWYSQFHPDTLTLFMAFVMPTYSRARSWPRNKHSTLFVRDFYTHVIYFTYEYFDKFYLWIAL